MLTSRLVMWWLTVPNQEKNNRIKWKKRTVIAISATQSFLKTFILSRIVFFEFDVSQPYTHLPFTRTRKSNSFTRRMDGA